MSAAEVLRRLTTQIGRGLTPPPRKRRLPILRCPACRANYYTATADPVRMEPCARCDTRIRRNSPRGMCPTCNHLVRTEEQQRASAVPHLHELARFGSPELATWCRDKEAISRALAFAEAPPPACRVLVFTGPTAAGKSSLVSAVVQHLADAGRVRRLVWTTARRLAEARIEHGLGVGEPPPLARAMRASVAVVDDLGKELGLPPAQAGEVVAFLERRHAGERPLVPPGALDIVTTELPVQVGAEEAAKREAAGETVRDLTRCYDLSFVRRLASGIIPGDVDRGSAVVIHVRRGP